MSAALGWNCVVHMATYVNSELFRELGGFRKEMKYAGDYEFFLRAYRDRAVRGSAGPWPACTYMGTTRACPLHPSIAPTSTR